jgi:hypothetical protein
MRTTRPLYVYYRAPNYYNAVGYYSTLFLAVYYDGYGYNFYYARYGYYEYSINLKEYIAPVQKSNAGAIAVLVVCFACVVGGACACDHFCCKSKKPNDTEDEEDGDEN